MFDGRHLLLVIAAIVVGIAIGIIQQKYFKD
jgi:F0F1-type ATP synthase assembly protein I